MQWSVACSVTHGLGVSGGLHARVELAVYTGVTQRLKQKEVIHHLDKAVRESFIQSMTDPSCVAFRRAVAQQGDITHYRPHEITVCVYTSCGLTLKLISAVYF